MQESAVKSTDASQKEHEIHRLLWSTGIALAALGISALLLLSAYIMFSSVHMAHRASDNRNTTNPQVINGSQLKARLGVAIPNKNNRLSLIQLSDERAILTRYTTLQASEYEFMEYQIMARNAGVSAYLIWRTAENPAVTSHELLYWTGDNVTTMQLSGNPNWKGNITEIGLDIYGELRGQPLVISHLSFLPSSITKLLSAIWSQWTAFTGWNQKSINYLGQNNIALPTPTVAAAAWAVLAIVLLLLASALKRGQPVVIVGVAILVPWLTLDMLWQRELNTQLAETRLLFSGKTMHEKHLADADNEIYRYTTRLEDEVLPEAPSRLFILHNSEGHNYERLKAQYYLLPINAYNYGKFPKKEHLKPGDFVLLLGMIPSLKYDKDNRQLTWSQDQWLGVELLDEDKNRMLFRITPAESAATKEWNESTAKTIKPHKPNSLDD